MKKTLFIIALFTLILNNVNGQQCKPNGCTTGFVKEYPTSGAPYTPPTSWHVLNNPATGNDALMNGGNWTRFNVVSGNKYEWTYCEDYGGVSTSWDAQLTLFNNTNISTPLCFSTDDCGTTGLAPYISWTATFTGVVRILTTAYVSGVGGCQSNSSTYNKLAYRQIAGTTCTYSISPSSISPSSSSGSGSISVTSASGCSWSAVSNNTSWLTVTSGSSGTGNGTVNYSYTLNGSSSLRTGTITIAGKTFTVTQAGTVSCSYTISPSSVSPTSSSGSGSVSVTATSGCSWTAISNNTSWLTVTSGSSGTGNGTVGYSYSTNSSSSSRTGTITVTGKTFTVTQAGIITSSLIDGIDVSYYQGTINWPQVSATGKVFAYIKATQGYTNDANDTYFSNNVTPAINSGLIIGAYHVAMPAKYSSSNEATHFLNTAGSYIGNGYLPPALDIEQSYAQAYYDQGNTKAKLAQWVNEWCMQIFNTKGIYPVIYVDRCRAADLYPYYQSGVINSNIKLWIADYGSISNPATPGSPGNASGCNWVGWPWLFHQYSETGTVSGITENFVDLDVFNGDITAFNNLINGNTTTGKPDLIVQNAQVSQTTVTMEQQITATCYNKNQGTGNASSSVTSLWFSKDQNFDNSDYYLGEISVSSLNAGVTSSQLSKQITIPTGPYSLGTWYIMFGADGGDDNVESSESNNQVFVQISLQGSTLSVTQSSLTLESASNSSGQINITSNVSWTASDDASWLTVSPANGSNNGTISVTATSANSLTSSRSGTVTITGGGITRNVIVTQSGISSNLEVIPTNLTIGAILNSTEQIGINSNVSWSASDNATWLSLTPSSGSNNGTITLTVTSANTSTSIRSGMVTITGGGITRTVSVAQDGASLYLDVTPSSLIIGASLNSTEQINVSSNVSWSASDNAPWLTVSPISGSNSGTITLTAISANTSKDSRNGTVIITGDGITRTVTVTQSGIPITPSLTVDPTSLTLGSASNSSGQINVTSNGSWTASDDASWLSVNPANGSNNGSITITATSANPSTTNTRGGIVTISGGGITRTVTVTQSKTTNCDPGWQNPTGKQYSMGIYAQVKIDDVINCSSGAVIGAFYNNECLGKTTLITGPAGCQFNLTIGSNTQNFIGVQLKLWDPATCETYELSPMFDFANDNNLGTISVPKLFSNIVTVNQVIPLVKGWNWISFNVIPEVNKLSEVLNYNKTNNDVIKTSTNLGGQATYFNGKWYDDIAVKWGVGYKLFVQSDNPGSINITGTPAPLGPISLTKDWNWLGYCPQVELDADIALNMGSWMDDNILKTSPDKGGQATYFNTKWWGPNYIMKPGLGYLINLSTAASLTYNGSGTKSLSIASEAISTNGWENPSGFEYTMGTHVQVKYNDELITTNDAVIGAFKDGECIGVSPIYNGPAGNQFQLSIASNVENYEGISLRFYDPQKERIYELDRNVKFTKDVVVGTIANPIVYNISEINVVEELDQSPMVYPNPFEDELNFEFTLNESQNVTIDLFDVTGKLVATILNKNLGKGKHKITWLTNDEKNGQLKSGIYVSIIKTANTTYTKKVILSKQK